MAKIWRRRGVSAEDIRDTLPVTIEAAPAQVGAGFGYMAVSRRGLDSDVPRGGTNVHQQSTSTSLSRRELMDQLYAAYLTCPWSNACVDTVARTVTAGGLHIVSDDDTKERTPTKTPPPPGVQRLQGLFDYTNPREDIRQLLRGILTDLQVTGDAFIEVVWLLGAPVALFSLDSATMVPIADEHGMISGYQQWVDGDRHVDFAAHEVLQISMDAPRGGVYGVGPTQKMMVPITTWLFTSGLLKETMRKGNPPNLHVDFPTGTPGGEMDRFTQQYLLTNLGIPNVGNPMVSRGGAKAAEMKAAQINEYLLTLMQRRDEILSGYGVPPAQVGVIESGNLGGGTGSSQFKTFTVNTCGPLEELVLEKLNFALLVPFGVVDWKIKFGEVDWRDDKTIEDIRDLRVRNASYTINRYREEIGEPAVDGGDIPFFVERQLVLDVADMKSYSVAQVAALAAPAAAAEAATQAAANGTAPDPQKPAVTVGKAKDDSLPPGAQKPGADGKPLPAGSKPAKESADEVGDWLERRRQRTIKELIG